MKRIIPYQSIYSNRLWLYVPVLFLFSFSPAVYAQNDTINEVEVIAASLPAQQLLVPSQTVTANDFPRYNVFNVADAVRNFSGITIKDYGGIGGLKTISVRGLAANHTTVLYDGIQVNDAQNGQIDLSKLNINGIQQITLYNAQPPIILQTARAFAGASILSIGTVNPNLLWKKTYQLTAGIKTGSFGLVNPYLQWQQKLNGKWAFAINSYVLKASGKYNFLLFDGAATTNQKRAGADVATQQLDGSLYWTDTTSKFSLRINYYNSDRGLPNAVILYAPQPTGQKLYNRDLFLQTGYKHAWRNGLQVMINAKLSQSQLRYFDPQFPNTAGVLDQHFSQREYYQSVALAYYLKSNWQVSYAADLALNTINADIGNFRYPKRLTTLNVLASNFVLGNLSLQGSLLHSHLHETVRIGATTPDRNILSPTIVATLTPFTDKNIQLRGFYKYVFRAPTFNDQYYGFISNINLRPELTRQYDLGITYHKSFTGWLDYVYFTTDGYYNNVSDKIISLPTVYNGYTTNLGKADIKGLDLGFKSQAKFSAYRVQFSANYSYQQALNVTSPDELVYLNQLPYTPLHTIALNAGLTKGKLGVYYNLLSSSSRYYGNENSRDDYLPPYSISDISASYKSSSLGFPAVLSAEVNNVFNKNYSVIQSYPMPGRSFRISFQITI